VINGTGLSPPAKIRILHTPVYFQVLEIQQIAEQEANRWANIRVEPGY